MSISTIKYVLSYLMITINNIFICIRTYVDIFIIILSGSAPVTNGMAIVTIYELECNNIYTIIARGALNGRLLGPISLHGSINTSRCESVARKEGGTKSCLV